MYRIPQSCRRSLRAAHLRFVLGACFLAACMAGAIGQTGPWPMFHQGAQRQGESATSLQAETSGFQVVSPKNRWNFPHLIPNRTQPNRPLPWNLGHVSASLTVGPGLSVAGANTVYAASYDLFKMEQPAAAGLITEPPTKGHLNRQFLPYTLENHGAVWAVDGSQGPNLNALTGDWWWGYRDAQVGFQTYDTGAIGAPGGDIRNGIDVRLIPGGDQPDVAGLTPAQINSGNVKPGSDPFSFREFQFLRMVSRALVLSYPKATGDKSTLAKNEHRLVDEVPVADAPVAPIRSTPSFFHLSGSISYTARSVSDVADLNDLTRVTDPSKFQYNDRQMTTSDIVVFGADDGYVYCLDVAPGNTTVYSWNDPEGQTHATRVANLIWRFNTLSFIKTQTIIDPTTNSKREVQEESTQFIQILSSPLVADLPGVGQVAVIGTGVGRVAALNLATGDLKASQTTGYTVSQIVTGRDPDTKAPVTIKVKQWLSVRSSPALYSGTGSPIVIYGADDGIAYGWDIAAPTSVNNPWKFSTGDAPCDPTDPKTNGCDPSDRSGLNNPPIVASPVVAANAERPMVLIGATGRKDKASVSTGIGAGVLYSLDPATGKEIWEFKSWIDPALADPKDPFNVSAPQNQPAIRMIGEIQATPAFSPAARLFGGPAGGSRVAFVRASDGHLYALFTDPAIATDEARMAWKAPLALEGDNAFANNSFVSSPVVTPDGTIYVGTGDGRIRGIRTDGSAPIRLSNNQLGTTAYPQGEPVWQFETGVLNVVGFDPRQGGQTYGISDRPIISTPAMAPNFLYMACDGEIFAFQDTNHGLLNIRNPIEDFIRTTPTKSEQPSSGNLNSIAEQNRIQAEIVAATRYGQLTANTPDATFDHNSSIANDQPGGVAWNAKTPGQLEWGDTVDMVAWNLDERVKTAIFRLLGPNGIIQVSVPVLTRTATAEPIGRRGFAKYGFTLDPFTPIVVNPAGGTMANPILNQPLTPGGDGSPIWTVVAVQTGLDAQGKPAGSQSSNSAATLAKFRINNPLDIKVSAAAPYLTAATPSDIPFNGNFNVPLAPFTNGHHNTTSPPQVLFIADRSHLGRVQFASQGGTVPAGQQLPRLRIRIAPAELQWLGGAKSVYKPLFRLAPDISGFARPAFSPLWIVASEEIPPAAPGAPNFSPDYPNIPAGDMEFKEPATQTDAVQQDILVPPSAGSLSNGLPIIYDVKIPKYQPANHLPLGRGYATVNPTNKFAQDILNNPSPKYLPQYPGDDSFLTRVYVDSNRNGAPDFNEAFRAFVTGTQVQVDENIDEVEPTVDLPGPSPFSAIPTPPGIAHGFVPYTGYNARVPNLPSSGDLARLRSESPFFQPFTLINTGNVNLWNVRMDKNPANVNPLLSGTVDPAPVQGSFSRYTGSLSPLNLQSTLDPQVDPKNPFGWIPIQKPRVNAPQGNRIQMIDPFSESQTQASTGGRPVPLPGVEAPDSRPRISVAVPIGAPVGKYSTQPVFFEDGKFEGQPGGGSAANWLTGANGRYTTGITLRDGETVDDVAVKKMVVTADVMESRLSGYMPLVFPAPGLLYPAANAVPDTTSPTAGSYPVQLPLSLGAGSLPPSRPGFTPSSSSPTAYRDAKGNLHAIWAMNLANSGGGPQWALVTSTLQFQAPDPVANPWGWIYQGTPGPGGFFDPTFSTYWWSKPVPIPLGGTLASFQIFGSPAVATDAASHTTVLFFEGAADNFSATSGTQRINQFFYLPLDASGAPAGPALSFPMDPSVTAESPHPFFFTTKNGATRLALAWDGGTPGRWNLYLSSIAIENLSKEGAAPNAATNWTRPFALPTPDGLSYAVQPSPFFKAVVGGAPYVDIVFSGFNNSEGNVDLYLERFTSSGDFSQWSAVPLPSVQAEPVRRLAGRPEYVTRGIDWAFTDQFKLVQDPRSVALNILWTRPGGAQLDFAIPDSIDSDTGIRTYTKAGYTLTADPTSGHLQFSSPNPVRFPLPNGLDRILVSYTPRAWRLTSDTRADTQPTFFIDRSLEMIPANQPYRIGGGKTLPAFVPRDRMWVIWRKGSADAGGGAPPPGGGAGIGPGTIGSTSLWYTTYRLMITLPGPVAVNQRGVPQLTLSGTNGPWTLDPGSGAQPGRVFFTEADEGANVTVTATGGSGGSSTLRYAVTWQPERSGDKDQEVQVPMKLPLNEGQVWAFKDPFSYLSPSDPNFAALSNNGIWLFWSSSRTGYSDIFYQVISPNL